MKNIKAHEFAKILKSGTANIICVDVRSACDFKSLHLKGTINIPIEEIMQHIEQLKKYDQVYVNCSSGVRSQKACDALKAAGLTNVTNVMGGLQACTQVGCCLDKAACRKINMPRKINIACGLLTLIGLILGQYLTPLFFLLPALVAISLIYAGVKGQCFWEKIIKK